MMAEKKISQIGATTKGRDYLRLLAGRSEESGAKADEEKSKIALFGEMKDAYRTLFIYGLLKGKRTPTGKTFTTIYAQLSMLSAPHEFSALLSSFGSSDDLEDIGKAINEYTNWAIEDIRKRYPSGSFSITDIRKLFE